MLRRRRRRHGPVARRPGCGPCGRARASTLGRWSSPADGGGEPAAGAGAQLQGRRHGAGSLETVASSYAVGRTVAACPELGPGVAPLPPRRSSRLAKSYPEGEGVEDELDYSRVPTPGSLSLFFFSSSYTSNSPASTSGCLRSSQAKEVTGTPSPVFSRAACRLGGYAINMQRPTSYCAKLMCVCDLIERI